MLSLTLAAVSAPMSVTAAQPAATQNAPTQMALGLHGMAVFGGTEGLYASHLPMFHTPHDSQVIFRFHLEDPQLDQSLRATLAQHAKLWTLAPEKFDLLRLSPKHATPLKQFNASFFDGHFERGGAEKFTNAQVVVDEMLFFKRLNAEKLQSRLAHYHLLGKGKERFLFKEIDQRPDYDHIVALRLKNSTRLPSTITLNRPTQKLQMPSAAEWNRALQALSTNIVHRHDIYFETEDLQ
jgi:hypothetical protein